MTAEWKRTVKKKNTLQLLFDYCVVGVSPLSNSQWDPSLVFAFAPSDTRTHPQTRSSWRDEGRMGGVCTKLNFKPSPDGAGVRTWQQPSPPPRTDEPPHPSAPTPAAPRTRERACRQTDGQVRQVDSDTDMTWNQRSGKHARSTERKVFCCCCAAVRKQEVSHLRMRRTGALTRTFDVESHWTFFFVF